MSKAQLYIKPGPPSAPITRTRWRRSPDLRAGAGGGGRDKGGSFRVLECVDGDDSVEQPEEGLCLLIVHHGERRVAGEVEVVGL